MPRVVPAYSSAMLPETGTKSEEAGAQRRLEGEGELISTQLEEALHLKNH